MVSQCIASLSLDLLHFLRSCFDDFYDLVNAIVVHTNWETQVEKLVQIIKDARNDEAVGKESQRSVERSPERSLGRSLSEEGVSKECSSSPEGVFKESRRSPLRTAKQAENDSIGLLRSPKGVEGVSGGDKT